MLYVIINLIFVVSLMVFWPKISKWFIEPWKMVGFRDNDKPSTEDEPPSEPPEEAVSEKEFNSHKSLS